MTKKAAHQENEGRKIYFFQIEGSSEGQVVMQHKVRSQKSHLSDWDWVTGLLGFLTKRHDHMTKIIIRRIC